MILTQNDRLHAGLGLNDGSQMTPLEFRKIRKSLRLTQNGMADLLESSKRTVVRYENETGEDASKIKQKHAEYLRTIMQMKPKEREEFIDASGCQISLR